MNIIAILLVRNEELYLRVCIDHLLNQGLQVAVIDNESEDRTSDICRSFSNRDLVHYETAPYPGCFDLRALLERMHALRRELEADWIVFQAADEILQSNRPGESLSAGIQRVAAEGFDTIDFNEFVFVPASDSERFEGAYYPDRIRHYYFFEPSHPRLIRAFCNGLKASNVRTGGHLFPLDRVRLYPESFLLRHYICLSMEHARAKYVTRKFLPAAVEQGWHQNRVDLRPEQFKSPKHGQLHLATGVDDRRLDTRSPCRQHFWQWDDGRVV